MTQTYRRYLATAGVLFLSSSLVQAGPNLGMKLACKEYGEAWQMGSRAQLASACTPALMQQFNRLKPEEFAALRAEMAKQSPAVVGSNKESGAGLVTIQTQKGLVHIQLVGSGFNWVVADVRSTNRHGQAVSLRENLDVTCTAREFMDNLADAKHPLMQDKMTPALRQSFTRVTPAELVMGREILGTPLARVGIDCVINGNSADVVVKQPGDHFVHFKLLRQTNGWKTEDVSFQTEQLSMASLRDGFDSFCAVVSLGRQIKHPDSKQDLSFVADRELRAELNQLADTQESVAEEKADAANHRLTISKDGKKAVCVESKRQSEITLTQESPTSRHQIAAVMVTEERGTQSLAKLLTMRRQLVSMADASRGLLSPKLFPFALFMDAERR